MSSNTVPRRSARLAEKMATPSQPLRRSPRLAEKVQQQTSPKPAPPPVTVTGRTNTDWQSFNDLRDLHIKKLRKYYWRYVDQHDMTVNNVTFATIDQDEFCFMVDLQNLTKKYPNTHLAKVFRF